MAGSSATSRAGEAPLLELDGIDTWRGTAHVLRGVSLRVGAGEAICLVGRNGAGKTTTLESAMGLLPVSGGVVRLRGDDVTRRPTHERAHRGLGFAPEDCGIFPDLTVAENLLIGRWLVRGRAAAGGEALDDRTRELFPELEALTARRGLNLSGGQKKMVAVARALALEPAVLLLDEPFEGLAPVIVTRLIEAARRIKALGIALLIAESNVTNAARIADRLYAIDRGEILFEGPPADALAHAEVMRTLRG